MVVYGVGDAVAGDCATREEDGAVDGHVLAAAVVPVALWDCFVLEGELLVRLVALSEKGWVRVICSSGCRRRRIIAFRLLVGLRHPR